MEVLPVGQARAATGAADRLSTIYFYVGLECGANEGEEPCPGLGRKNARLDVVNSGSNPRRSLLVRGAHPQLGGFELEASVVLTRDAVESSKEVADDVTMAFMGRSKLPVVDIKRHVERLHDAHRRVRRKAGKREEPVRGPFVLPDEVDAGSNVVLVQVRMTFYCGAPVRCADRLDIARDGHIGWRDSCKCDSLLPREERTILWVTWKRIKHSRRGGTQDGARQDAVVPDIVHA